MFAGLAMLCCMGRLRCSDANRIRHAGLVGRYAEGALTKTKTARTKEKSTSFISLVVPSFGLLGKPWFVQFVEARRCLGLPSIATLQSKSYDTSFVLVPEQAGLAYDGQSPIGSVEVTDRLRLLLSGQFDMDAVNQLSSHSLKAP